MRLQLEILKKSDDDSIYAWKAPLDNSGLLATWPTAFVDSGNIIQIVFLDDPTPWIPPTMTPIGLRATWTVREGRSVSGFRRPTTWGTYDPYLYS